MGRIIIGKFKKKRNPASRKTAPSRRSKAPIVQVDFALEAFRRNVLENQHLWAHRVEKYGMRADTGFHSSLLFRLDPEMIDHAVAGLQKLPKRVFDWERLSEDQRFACVVGACVINATTVPDFVRRLNRYQRGVMMMITAIRTRGEAAVLRDTKLYQRVRRIMRESAGVDSHD